MVAAVNGIVLTAAPARFTGRITMNADAPLPIRICSPPFRACVATRAC